MDTCKQRAVRVALMMLGILAIGLLFSFGATHWGWWLPCVFNQITGLDCPGCGISRMCLALLRLDFESAFHWNPAVMLCLPILAYLLGYLAYRYIRYNDLQMHRWQQGICWAMVAGLLLFGVLRNLC